MTRKETDLVKNAVDFERKLLKARKRLIKLIDSESKLSKDRIDVIAEKGLTIDERHWTLSKGKRVLTLINKTLYNSDEAYHNDVKEKMLVLRGESYTLVEVWQLGDCGYYTIHFILENEKEL